MGKKKQKSSVKKSPDIRKRLQNKDFMDKSYFAVKKLLHVYGLDPNIFDQFSKKQRNLLLLCEIQAPKFRVAEGCRIPQQLITLLNSSTYHFLKNNYYGDESNGLTYLELATFGISFYYQIIAIHDSANYFPPEQMEIVDIIAKEFLKIPVFRLLDTAGEYIGKYSQMISKINFRIYGFNWEIFNSEDEEFVQSIVTIYSDECESILFSYENKSHKAFRIKNGRVSAEPSRGARIDEWFISGKKTDEIKYLDIYIQSHALQQIKERMDIFPAHQRNFYAMDTLLSEQEVVFGANKCPMFECYYEDVLFGYYPFIVQGDKLFVLSFQPVISPDTPKGLLLAKRLNLQKEDMKYLGMDKLSFFFTVDFSQIPLLRKALVKVGLGPLLDYASEDLLPFERDAKKTLRVKKFFELAARNMVHG
jgi:hypothetical protein